MAIDPRYVAMQDLEELFVDKSTGLFLANGTIEFYEDDNRSNPKPVFQLTGAPPNYTFTQLPNPLPLSMISTPSNGGGDDNIAVYYYPYDAQGNVQLYYVVVKGADNVVQFTREAWPANCWTNNGGGSGGDGKSTFPDNLLSNPQFVDLNFDPSLPFIITIPGTVTATDYAIAPGWALRVSTTGAATIELSRDNLPGNSGYPTNPPYSLTIDPSGSITALALVQLLRHNPGIWSALQDDTLGYVATSVTLGIPHAAVSVVYTPIATGSSTTLLSASNNTGLPVTYNDTVQIPASSNSTTSDVGSVEIVINLNNLSSPTEITSIQVVAMDVELVDVPYQQEPVARQKDHLAHYYKPQLEFKPIPSYLVGWNFKQNPAQLLGDNVAPQAIGANKSYYAWDQTIIFQSVDSGFTISRGTANYTNGSLHINPEKTGQVAIIQYLDQSLARELLCNRLAVNIWSSTLKSTGLKGTVTLWATDSASLPDLNTPNFNSIVGTLDANGAPATLNGSGWVEIPRGGLPRNTFTSVYQAIAVYEDYLGYPIRVNLNGWYYPDAVANIVDHATYFAIVIGWEPMVAGEHLDIMNVALCTGDMATNWAPKSYDETLRDCERYFEKSYASSTPAGTITNVNMRCGTHGINNNGGNTRFQPAGFNLAFNSLKRTASPAVYIYSPTSATVDRVDMYIWQPPTGILPGGGTTTFSALWDVVALGDKSVAYSPKSSGYEVPANAGLGSAYINYHYVVDARLGVV